MSGSPAGGMTNGTVARGGMGRIHPILTRVNASNVNILRSHHGVFVLGVIGLVCH